MMESSWRDASFDDKPVDARQTARLLLAAWNSHDPERVAAAHAPEFSGRDVAHRGAMVGPRGAAMFCESMLRAFPGLQLSEEELLGEGDACALLWRLSGCQEGPFLSIPATRRNISTRGVTILEVHSGLVTRSETIWDVAGVLRSLSLLPDLP
jgi:steroid delta-isomerase-like uncharacterized protein